MVKQIRNSASAIILMAITLFTGNVLFAQPGQGQQGGGQQGGQQRPPAIPNTNQIKKMVSNLAEEITLTDKQEVSVLELYTKHFEEVKAKTSGNSRPNREEMEALDTSFEKQVKAVLTEEQQKKFVAWQKKNNPRQSGQKRQ